MISSLPLDQVSPQREANSASRAMLSLGPPPQPLSTEVDRPPLTISCFILLPFMHIYDTLYVIVKENLAVPSNNVHHHATPLLEILEAFPIFHIRRHIQEPINYLNIIMQSLTEEHNQDLERGDTITSFAPITASLAKVGVARQPGDNAHREAAELVKTSLHFS